MRPTEILFVHQNAPGQFKHLAEGLSKLGKVRVSFLTSRPDYAPKGVNVLRYEAPKKDTENPRVNAEFGREVMERGVRAAEMLTGAVARGYRPDLVVGHPGWGELMFISEVVPSVPVISYGEYWYGVAGSDYDHGRVPDARSRVGCRLRNVPLRAVVEEADAIWCPTHWQAALHPAALQPRIRVIHDGIDPSFCRPYREASFALPGGRTIRRGEPVLTYAVRALEPHRGFLEFAEAAEAVLARKPDLSVVVVGRLDPAYGPKPAEAPDWLTVARARFPRFASSAIHIPWLEHKSLVALFNVSACHVYLTVPFVPSWSLVESMACEAPLVVADTGPVREFVQDGETGLSAPLSEPAAIAGRILQVLGAPDEARARARRAREVFLAQWSLPICLGRQVRLFREVIAGRA